MKSVYEEIKAINYYKFLLLFKIRLEDFGLQPGVVLFIKKTMFINSAINQPFNNEMAVIDWAVLRNPNFWEWRKRYYLFT